MKIEQLQLTNTFGSTVTILNFGARIAALTYQIGNRSIPIVLNYPNTADYLTDPYYVGAIVGRYCNRIYKGQLPLQNKLYQLSINEPPNHLHGGFNGFDKKFWTVLNSTDSMVQLQYIAKDGEEGYPGNLTALCTYTLDDNQALTIALEATADKPTIVNLTNHSYFNLNHSNDSTIDNHNLILNGTLDDAIDKANNPLPRIKSMSVLGKQALDHNFKALNNTIATIQNASSGISVTIESNYSSFQCYSGDYLSGTFKPRQGLCIEPQFAPNSPNLNSNLVDTGYLLQPNSIFKKYIKYYLNHN